MLADINLREIRQGVFEYIGPAENNKPKHKQLHRNRTETQ